MNYKTAYATAVIRPDGSGADVTFYDGSGGFYPSADIPLVEAAQPLGSPAANVMQWCREKLNLALRSLPRLSTGGVFG